MALEELTPEEVQALLEAERDAAEPAAADQGILETVSEAAQQAEEAPESEPEAPETRRRRLKRRNRSRATDPFDEIDFGSFFDDYLDPGLQEPGLGVGRQAVL